MRVLVLLLLFLADFSCALKLWAGRFVDKQGFGSLGLPHSENKASSQHKEEWFDQRLDHFDPTNTRTWKQRYFVSGKYYNGSENAPIFLQLGGEGEASPVWLDFGQIATNYGPHYSAFQVLLEHRYYGKSHPTSDMSTKNLKYLTSEQALQDAANFIEFIRKKHDLHRNKLIVFGGSYSGSLAAWFRLKYPHIAAGAIASSAPVEAVLNFKEYIQVVEKSLGPECVKPIKSATNRLIKMLESGDETNWKIIEKKFRLCTPLNGSKPMDISNLVATLADNFEGVVQYNKDNRKFEGADSNITIDDLCSIMTDVDSGTEPLDRLAKVNDLFYGSGPKNCLDYKYEDYLKQMLVDDFDRTEVPGARQWIYQTCTEFGFYQTSDDPDHIFGSYFPLKFFIQQCMDIYGPKFNQRFIEQGIDFSNNYYGGWNLTLTNVLFPNGLIDPWHALGVLKPINPTAQPLIIKGTAHCADMYPDWSEDPPQLARAREIIKQTIGKFLVAH